MQPRYFCALVLAAVSVPLPFLHAQDKAPSASTLQVKTRLVMVPVVVRDKKNLLVNNLKQADFTVTEDGQPRTIRYFDHDNDLPLTLGLLVDVSMSQHKVLDDERDASSAFLDDMLAPDRDKAFVIQFAGTVDLLADVTPSVPKLQAALKRVDAEQRPSFDKKEDDTSSTGSNSGSSGSDRRGGYGHRGDGPHTALYDAIFLASDEVISKQSNRKALILLTDGEDRGSKTNLAGAIEAAQRADTAVYAIYYKGEEPHHDHGGFGGRPGGMGGGRGHFPGGGTGGSRGGGGESHVDGKKILERIADETGGQVYEVTGKLTVAQIYKQIAEELRNQYRIGFTPGDAAEGYHQIAVTVPKENKLRIQTRDGYYVGSK